MDKEGKRTESLVIARSIMELSRQVGESGQHKTLRIVKSFLAHHSEIREPRRVGVERGREKTGS